MVAVVSGSGLGLFGSSVSALGGIGGSGNAAPGRGNDRVYVNTTTGNLIVQSQDERLTALGLDLNLVRTYNSQGLMDDDNGDNWRLGVQQRLYNLVGTVNRQGSSITKEFGDGREVTYAYDEELDAYVSTEGDGAHDTLKFTSDGWQWREGTSQVAELYDEQGRLRSATDSDGNDVVYTYTDDLLTGIHDASGQDTTLVYSGRDLVAIQVASNGHTESLTSYTYDARHRLSEVRVDLTPENTADSDVYVTSYTYEGSSRRVASVTQSDGTSVSFTYQFVDGQHRVHTYTDLEGKVTTFDYTHSTGDSAASPIGTPVTETAKDSALSTTRSDTYELDPSVAGNWAAAALLENDSELAANPQIKFDASGNGFAVWAQGSEVVVRRYTASTGAWSTAQDISSPPNNIPVFSPQIAIDRVTGQAIVTWKQGSGTSSVLCARVFDPASGTWGIDVGIGSDNSKEGPDGASVAMNNGQAAVAWTVTFNGVQSICFATFDGQNWSAVQDAETSAGSAMDPKVAVAANGDATVVWRQFDDSSGGYRIFTRRWDASSQSFETPLTLDDAGGRQPRLGTDAQGNLFALWGDGAIVRRFDVTTGQWSAEQTLGAPDASGAELAVDAGGNAIVAWIQNDGTTKSVYARRYDAATDTWDATKLLEHSANPVDGEQAISVSMAGNAAVVAWVQDNGTLTEVYTARMTAGTWASPTLLETRSESADQLTTAIDTAGNATVLWQQSDGVARSIYQAHYAAPTFTVPSGATWQSVANALYGVNSAAAGKALQTAMGGGALSAGMSLRGLPVTLQLASTVPAYYKVQASDSWAHITQAIYGTTDNNAIAQLRAQLDDPTLTAGLMLTVPASLSFNVSGTYTAPANSSAIDTTRIDAHNLNPSALSGTGNWEAVALLENDSEDANNPQIKFDADGNGLAVWAQGSEIIARRYDASTASWSAAENIANPVNTAPAFAPQLAIDPVTGQAVASWVQNYGASTVLYYNFFDPASGSWGTSGAFVTGNISEWPDGASLSMNNGQAALAWTITYNDVADVTVQIFDGSDWDLSLGVKAAWDGPATQPNVVMAENGDVTVVWRQFDYDDNEYHIATRRWNAATQVFEPTVTLDDVGDREPRIGADAQGNVFAVWGDGALVRRFDVTTGQWSAEQALGGVSAQGVELAVDAAGDALAVWVESDGTARSVYARRYDAASDTWGAATLVEHSVNPVSSDRRLSVALTGNDAIVAWIEDTGTSSDAYAARMSDGLWSAPTLLESRSESADQLQTAIDAAGNAVVLWQQADGTAPSIYQAHYAASYFTVPSGATWQSIANAIYGVNSAEAGIALRTALNDIPLSAGMRLSGLPSSLDVSSTVAPYYTVQGGDTWARIARSVYGVSDVNAIAELQSEVGNPTLTTGLMLTVPATISFTAAGTYTAALNRGAAETTHSDTYNLNPSAISGAGTWDSAALLEIAGAEASNPQLKFDASGNGFAVWAQDNQVLVRRYTAVTNSWSVAQSIAPANDGNPTSLPQLVIDDVTGQALVSWIQDYGTTPVLYDCIFDPANGTWSTPDAITTGTFTQAPESISISMNNGRAVAVWTTDYGSGAAVYISFLTSQGWDHTQGVQANLGESMHPSVVLDANGDATVVWRQFSEDDGEYRIVTRRWDEATQSFGTQAMLDADGDRDPRIGMDANGNVFAVWGGGVDVRRFDAATGVWSAQTALDNGSGTGSGAEIAVDANGNALLAWAEDDGTAQSLYARRYDAASGTWGTATLLESSNADISPDHRITLSFDGGEGLVAWLQDNSTATGSDLYAARFSNGAWGSPTLLESRSESPSEVIAAVDADGYPMVLWVQPDGTAPSIYRSHYDRTPYYTVPSGATWQSIANTLYGVNSAAAGSTLQAALGSPTLSTGLQLRGLPATLVLTQNVPAFYTVQDGDTWVSITQALYGTHAAEAATALQSALGNPTLTAGLELTLPASITYSSSSDGMGSVIFGQTDVTGNGVVTRYEQDEEGRLAAVTTAPDSLALRTEYKYDGDGNVSRIVRDPNGLNRVTTMVYDERGNLLSQRDDLGNTIERTYNEANQLLTETVYLTRDPDGAGEATASAPLTTHYTYDSENHLRFTVSAEGRVTEYRYNATGQRILALTYTGATYASNFGTAPLARWVSQQDLTQLQRIDYTYDFRGNLSSATSATSTDSNGIPNGSTSTTRFVYDQRGQLLQTIGPRGSATATDATNSNLPYATTYTYDGLGRVQTASQWTANGKISTTCTHYDDANRATSVTLANGLVMTTVYGLSGEVVSVSHGTHNAPDSLGTTTYTYDDQGRLRFQTDPTGMRQFFEYDDAGRQIATVDGDGTLTEVIYDHFGRAIKTVEYGKRLTAAMLASLVAGNERDTSVDLSDMRAMADDTPDADRINRSVYDAAGLLIYTIDAKGAVTQYFYDGAGRVTDEMHYAQEVTIPASADEVLDGSFSVDANDPDNRLVRHFYDADGLLRGTSDGEGYLVAFEYDSAGQLVHQVGYANPTSAGLRLNGTFEDLLASAGTDEEETPDDPERDIHSYFFYDGQGRRIGVLDGEGYLTTTAYEVDGQVSSQTRYDKRLTFSPGSTFESLRNAAVASNAVSHTSTFVRDGAGRLISETNFEGTVTHYAYDDVGDLISTTRAFDTDEARTTQTQYDLLGRVTKELTAEGSEHLAAGENATTVWERYSVSYAYDDAGRRISASVSPSGTQQNVTLYYYDTDGRLQYEISPLGEVTEYIYNAFGELTDTIGYAERLVSTEGLHGGAPDATLHGLIDDLADANRDSHTVTTYTVRGEVDTVTTAESAQKTFTYNAFGELETQVQQLASATQSAAAHELTVTNVYDHRGLLKESHSVGSDVSTLEQRDYDAFGRLTKVTDPNGNVSKQEYDRLGRIIVTRDAVEIAHSTGHSTCYDAFDRVLSTTDALGNKTTYEYDEDERSVVMTTPELVSVTTTHNRHGQQLTVAAAGNTTVYSYDANGQLTEVSDSLSAFDGRPLEVRTYDRAGREITSSDALGIKTTFTYDAVNRVLCRIEDDGGLSLTTHYTYDGNVMRVVEPNGKVTETVYDRDGRVKSVTVNPEGPEPLSTGYQYDLGGRVIMVTEGSDNPRRTQYSYDDLGRRIEEIVDPGSGVNPATGLEYLNLTTQYKYDTNGNLTRKIDGEHNSTWYVYDADNRLTYTIDALGGVTFSNYDNDDRVIETRRYATALSGMTMSTLASLDVVTTADFSVAEDTLADRTTQSVYDDDGRERFTIDALYGVTERTFDDNGNVVVERVYACPIAAGTYTCVGQVTDALGSAIDTAAPGDRFQQTTYDLRGHAIMTIDGLGAVVDYIRDASGNVTLKKEFAIPIPLDGGPFPDFITWNTDPNNRSTRYWYDSTNRLRFTLDAEGYLTELRYDDAGRQEQQIVYAKPQTIPANITTADLANGTSTFSIATDANDQTTTTTYDAAGRVHQVHDASGLYYEEYSYDALGNKLSYRNKLGAIWKYVYDANGRLLEEQTPQVAVTNVNGSTSDLSAGTAEAVDYFIVTRMEYDDLGNVKSRTEGVLRDIAEPHNEDASRARTTRYEYDALGRQTVTTFPEVGVYSYSETDVENQTHSADEFGVGGNLSRTDYPTELRSEVFYDALGNAYRRDDVALNLEDLNEVRQSSYKVYDRLGRVTSDIDALKYVTSYDYDTFGNQTGITRHAETLTGDLPTSGSSTISVAPNADDRTITKTYDRLNRVTKVIEPASYVYDTTSGTEYGGDACTVGATTEFEYNSFGNVVRESHLIIGSTYANTYFYYDHVGNRTAQIDAEGYLTKYKYDATGNLREQDEYADPITGAITTSDYPEPLSTASHRHAAYVYDELHQLTQEHHSLTYNEFASDDVGAALTDIPGDDDGDGGNEGETVTTYGYDALGNRTRVSVNGAETRTYYDVLGRIRGVVGPPRDIGNQQSPRSVTTTDYDAFSNAVRIVQHALYATSDEDPSAVPADLDHDRTTLMAYDALNHVIHTRDASGADRYASYTARGDVAKEWQPVTNKNDQVTEYLVTIYDYDALGRQTGITEPQSLGGTEGTVMIHRESEYNAFGEITLKRINGDVTERFDYDHAGRVWRTNSGDGIYKLYLYNLAGKATAEIRSQDSDLSTVCLHDLEHCLPNVTQMRTETVYDKLGRVLEQRDVTYDIASTLQPSTASFYLDNYHDDERLYLYWTSATTNETAQLSYRLKDRNDQWVVVDTSELSVSDEGYDVSALGAGDYEFKVTFTRDGATSPYSIHSGTFTIDPHPTTSSVDVATNSNEKAQDVTASVSGNVVSVQWPISTAATAAEFAIWVNGAWQTGTATPSDGKWHASVSGIDANGQYAYRITESVNGQAVITNGTLDKTNASTVSFLRERVDNGIARVSAANVGTLALTVDATLQWSAYADRFSVDFWLEGQHDYEGHSATVVGTTAVLTSLLADKHYHVRVMLWEFNPEDPDNYILHPVERTFYVTDAGSITDVAIVTNYGSSSVSIGNAVTTSSATSVQLTWPFPTTADRSEDKVSYHVKGSSDPWILVDSDNEGYSTGGMTVVVAPGATIEMRIERGHMRYWWEPNDDINPPQEWLIDTLYTGELTITGTTPKVVRTDGFDDFFNGVHTTLTPGWLTWHEPREGGTDYLGFDLYDLLSPTPTAQIPGASLITNLGNDDYALDLRQVHAPGKYDYVITYYHADGTSYKFTSGHAELVLGANGTVTILSSAALDPIGGFTQVASDDHIILGWTQPTNYAPGDIASFRYRLSVGDDWSDPLPVDTGPSVDLSGLPRSDEDIDYLYELTYTHDGTTYAAASGLLSLRKPDVHGNALLDTTQNELTPTSVTPRFVQKLDAWGNVTSYQDAMDQTKYYDYNERNQVTQVTQPTVSLVSTLNGDIVRSSAPPISHNYYDQNGLLIATVDPNGNRKRLTYDDAGQLIKEQTAERTDVLDTLSEARQYAYNAFGEQIQITDELGYRTRMSYDQMGRLVATAKEVTQQAFNHLDTNGDGLEDGDVLVDASRYAITANNVVSIAYVYDEGGRRTSETTGEVMDGGTSAETIRYWYDLQGNLIRSRLPTLVGYGPFDTTYGYDHYGNGQKIRETDAIGGIQNWVYDAFGQLQSHITIHGPTGIYSNGETVTYIYDKAGLLKTQTSDFGRSISYEYDNAGHLTRILEDSNSQGNGLEDVTRESIFGYDKAGRRTYERVTVDNTVYQNTTATYDALGRLSTLSDLRYSTTYEYDAAGNRTHIETHYIDPLLQGAQLKDDQLWYTYDGANRVRISQGTENATTHKVGYEDRTVELTYNAAGQRVTSLQSGQTYSSEIISDEQGTHTSISVGHGFFTSIYNYDGLGRLTSQTRSASGDPEDSQDLTDTREYDRAGRMIHQFLRFYDDNFQLHQRYMDTDYDDAGRMKQQTTHVDANEFESSVTYGVSTFSNTSWSKGFDAAGNLRGYDVVQDGVTGTIHHLITYRAGDSYQELTHTSEIDDNESTKATTTRTYNVNGELIRFEDEADSSKNRHLVNNSDGQAMKVVQGDYEGAAEQTALRDETHAYKPKLQLFFNHEQVGTLTSAGLTNNPFYIANFDVNYTPVSGDYPGQAPAQVVVQEGDTLRLVASRIWGDGNLWYLIADANGLQDPDALLPQGQVLQIPNEVVTLANTADSFKPFNLNEVLGDTTPTQPAPPPPKNGGGCGVVGQILVTVVAIIATYYLGPAIGNAVSQAFAIAIGQQDGFSWEQVAAAVVTSGITQGTPIGQVGAQVSTNGFVQAAVQGAVNSTVSQGVNVAMGLQDSFSWREVALSAASTAVSSQVGQWTQGKLAGASMSDTWSGIGRDVASGVASALVRRSLGGRMDTDAILADVFGNALGNSIVDAMTPTAPGLAETLARNEADLLGMSAPELNIADGVLWSPAEPVITKPLDNNPDMLANLPMPQAEYAVPAQRDPLLEYARATIGDQWEDTLRVGFKSGVDRQFDEGFDRAALKFSIEQVTQEMQAPQPLRSGASLYDQFAAMTGISNLRTTSVALEEAAQNPTLIRTLGALRAIEGGFEISGGTMLSEIPPLAAAIIAHGADVTQAGLNQLRTGEYWNDYTTEGLQLVGFSPGVANGVDATLSLLGGVGVPFLKGAGVLDEMLAASRMPLRSVDDLASIPLAEISPRGPMTIIARDAVDLAEFRRLNTIDPAVGRIRPGEAGLATELQRYLGVSLERAPMGTAGDFVVGAGPRAGTSLDLMLTPDTFKQAASINRYFEKNLQGFSRTLDMHLGKADLVPIDTRFLTLGNQDLLLDMVNRQPLQLQQKIILIR